MTFTIIYFIFCLLVALYVDKTGFRKSLLTGAGIGVRIIFGMTVFVFAIPASIVIACYFYSNYWFRQKVRSVSKDLILLRTPQRFR